MSRLLIIEDEPNNARLAQKLLRRAGHEVEIAEDGEIALAILQTDQPDLILADLGLPDIDGQTLVAMLRQQTRFANTPIVAFTAWPEPMAMAIAQAYAFTGVILKPINTHEFARQVGCYLEPPLP